MRMNTTRRSLLVFFTALLPLAAAHAQAGFFSAGVAGKADADAASTPCATPGKFAESYRTFPLDAFVSFAQGTATAFNPCSALSGSPLSAASASLGTGQLRVFALAQLDNGNHLSQAKARAYFSDDVGLLFNGVAVDTIAGGVGQIRMDVHGSRSTDVLNASAELEVTGPLGEDIGSVEIDDLHGGDSLVVLFNTPFSFSASLNADVENGQFADFGSTARLSISLPPGYSFSSASGVLLAVPEPSTWAPMLAGLGGLAWALRRRRR